jgi:hypothetical protein
MNTEARVACPDTTTGADEIHSSATSTLRADERKQESSNPHATECQVFDLGQAFFDKDKQGGAA